MTRNQAIRAEALLQLYAARPLALSAANMARQCRKDSMDYTETELHRELTFLASAGHAEAVEVATGEEKFTLTATGVIAHERGL